MRPRKVNHDMARDNCIFVNICLKNNPIFTGGNGQNAYAKKENVF